MIGLSSAGARHERRNVNPAMVKMAPAIPPPIRSLALLIHTVKGYTLSVAKQVLNGKMDSVIKMAEHNIRLL
jgi:hypothetical protein